MNDNDIVLEVKSLTKKFSGLTAVNDLSFQVRHGRLHALIGPNGAGKTTTVNMITGALPVTSGDVLFHGKTLLNKEAFQRAALGIGRTFQNIKVFSSMTVLENLLIGGQHHTDQSLIRFLINPAKAKQEEKKLVEKAEDILASIGMYELRNEVAGSLPYGRQKMTELGRTLMTDPTIILLDEPAAGLNPSERKEFIGIIQNTFEKGIDMFLIEHNMDVVMNLSHDITVLNFGSLIAFGSPKEIQNNDEVITAYLGKGYREQMKKNGGSKDAVC